MMMGPDDSRIEQAIGHLIELYRKYQQDPILQQAPIGTADHEQRVHAFQQTFQQILAPFSGNPTSSEKLKQMLHARLDPQVRN